MREIKFRAWDINNKEMSHCWNIKHVPQATMAMLGHDSPIVLQQFTGLLDKNGKEIYEGDIMRWEDRNPPKEETTSHSFGNVYWGNSGMWMVELNEDWHFPLGENLDHSFEVIGNIYENGDLIK